MDIYIENIQISDRFDHSSVKISECSGAPGDDRPIDDKIRFIYCDSIDAAKSVKSPCVLNFANAQTPGGPTNLHGTTQEEVLWKRTSLGCTLSKSYYPIDDIVDKYQYWHYKSHSVIYSPRVYVLRDDEYSIIDTHSPDIFSVISCAAINNPRTTGQKYLLDRDRVVTRQKIALMLDVAALHSHTFVAGQWGCGAFGNPLEICSLWVEEINKRNIDVVFPIYNESFEIAMLEAMVDKK